MPRGRQRGPRFQSFGINLIAANEYGVIFLPKHWAYDQSAPAVIHCPAATIGAYNLFDWTPAYKLAERGVAVVCSDLGDTPSSPGTYTGPTVWANDASMTKLTAVYNYVMNTLKALPGEIGLTGASHGGATASRWFAANQDKCSSLLLGIPVVDMRDVLDNDSPWETSIRSAWSLGPSDPFPSGKTGVELASAFIKPVLNYYSTTDDVGLAATQIAFQAANPSMIENRSLGAIGHTLVGLPSEEAADWVLQHLV